ncbi:MAG: hypothetical protein JWP03_4604 [Phycisphaerales bacterium]|nr:hypothetical protein [Phycisphaerales bacterium]
MACGTPHISEPGRVGPVGALLRFGPAARPGRHAPALKSYGALQVRCCPNTADARGVPQAMGWKPMPRYMCVHPSRPSGLRARCTVFWNGLDSPPRGSLRGWRSASNHPLPPAPMTPETKRAPAKKPFDIDEIMAHARSGEVLPEGGAVRIGGAGLRIALANSRRMRQAAYSRPVRREPDKSDRFESRRASHLDRLSWWCREWLPISVPSPSPCSESGPLTRAWRQQTSPPCGYSGIQQIFESIRL